MVGLPDETGTAGPAPRIDAGIDIAAIVGKIRSRGIRFPSDAVRAVGPPHPASPRYLLTLEDTTVGMVTSVEGGAIYADVVETASSGPFVEKSLGPARFEAITVRTGLGMAGPFYEWVAASWGPDPKPRDGTLTVLDVEGQAVGEIAFHEALITRTIIPAADASQKTLSELSVRFEAASLEYGPPGTEDVPPVEPQAKAWVASNFRFELGNLDTTKVTKVAAITIDRPVVEEDGGRVPGAIRFGDVQVELSASNAQSWVQWHEDFVINGNSGEENELEGRVRWLPPNLQGELGRLDLLGVGIWRLGATPMATPDSIQRVIADLYCERMELQVS